MDILDLIKLLQGATVNVNVNVNTPEEEVEVETPTSDFKLGETVIITHTKHSGDIVNTTGTITDFGEDAHGAYVRALGANDKHYRAGVNDGEERLGTTFYKIDA